MEIIEHTQNIGTGCIVSHEILNKGILEQVKVLESLIEISAFPKKSARKLNMVDKKTLISYIKFIKYFYNNPNVIAYNGRAYAYNNKINYFMLKNNIMLDASGKFLELYNLSDKFQIENSERVINHSNTTINFIDENSATDAINRNSVYFTELTKYIKKHVTNDDKVLIIGREDDKQEFINNDILFESGKVEFTNFDAMRGKNDRADFNKCFVIHTPNQPYHNW